MIFEGASAEAVAGKRIGVGDEIHLGLKGAVWKDAEQGVRTPGKSQEADLVFRRGLSLRVKKSNVEELAVDVPFQLASHQSKCASLEHSTPLGKASKASPSGQPLKTLAPGQHTWIYASPAFAKRVRLFGDAAPTTKHSPDFFDATSNSDGDNRRTSSFGRQIDWHYAGEVAPSLSAGPPDAVATPACDSPVPGQDVGGINTESHPSPPATKTPSLKLPQAPPPDAVDPSVPKVSGSQRFSESDQQPAESPMLANGSPNSLEPLNDKDEISDPDDRPSLATKAPIDAPLPPYNEQLRAKEIADGLDQQASRHLLADVESGEQIDAGSNLGDNNLDVLQDAVQQTLGEIVSASPKSQVGAVPATCDTSEGPTLQQASEVETSDDNGGPKQQSHSELFRRSQSLEEDSKHSSIPEFPDGSSRTERANFRPEIEQNMVMKKTFQSLFGLPATQNQEPVEPARRSKEPTLEPEWMSLQHDETLQHQDEMGPSQETTPQQPEEVARQQDETFQKQAEISSQQDTTPQQPEMMTREQEETLQQQGEVSSNESTSTQQPDGMTPRQEETPQQLEPMLDLPEATPEQIEDLSQLPEGTFRLSQHPPQLLEEATQHPDDVSQSNSPSHADMGSFYSLSDESDANLGGTMEQGQPPSSHLAPLPPHSVEPTGEQQPSHEKGFVGESGHGASPSATNTLPHSSVAPSSLAFEATAESIPSAIEHVFGVASEQLEELHLEDLDKPLDFDASQYSFQSPEIQESLEGSEAGVLFALEESRGKRRIVPREYDFQSSLDSSPDRNAEETRKAAQDMTGIRHTRSSKAENVQTSPTNRLSKGSLLRGHVNIDDVNDQYSSNDELLAPVGSRSPVSKLLASIDAELGFQPSQFELDVAKGALYSSRQQQPQHTMEQYEAELTPAEGNRPKAYEIEAMSIEEQQHTAESSQVAYEASIEAETPQKFGPPMPWSSSYSQSQKERQAEVNVQDGTTSTFPPTPRLTQQENFLHAMDSSAHDEQLAQLPQKRRRAPRYPRSSAGGFPEVLSTWFTPRSPPLITNEPADHVNWSNGVAPEPEAHGDEATIANGITPPTTAPESGKTRATGFTTALSYFTPLDRLGELVNPASQSASGNSKVDILAIVTDRTKEPAQAKSGPKDYHTILRVSDLSVTLQHSVRVEVFRPWSATLPLAHQGDVILLRNFAVRSRKRHPYLLSTDSSAWCVWRYEDVTQKEKPVWARKPAVSGVQEEVRGPPVELSDEEQSHAKELRGQWMKSQPPGRKDRTTLNQGVDEPGDTGAIDHDVPATANGPTTHPFLFAGP